jgi:hypothetical protein
MRKLVLLLIICGAASGQSMRESGAVIAGTTIGSAAGKKVSDGINSRLKKTGKILDTAAKAEPKQTKSAPAAPLLQVGAGVPKAEVNNVPPPPPRRAAVAKTPKIRTVDVPMVMSSVLPAAPPPPPANVDLAEIHNGMVRDSVLALGIPSARITMYEDQHLIEIYQYRNATTASGTVRLRDGAVWAVEARP